MGAGQVLAAIQKASPRISLIKLEAGDGGIIVLLELHYRLMLELDILNIIRDENSHSGPCESLAAWVRRAGTQ